MISETKASCPASRGVFGHRHLHFVHDIAISNMLYALVQRRDEARHRLAVRTQILIRHDENIALAGQVVVGAQHADLDALGCNA